MAQLNIKDLLDKLKSLKSPENINLDNKKIILILIFFLIIVYMDFTFIMGMQLKSIRAAGPNIKNLEENITALTKDLNNMKNLKNKGIDVKQKPHAKVKKFILEGEIASLLRDISDIADKYKIKITQIKPSKAQRGRFDKTSEAAKLNPLLINLDLSCDYHRLGHFINDLESSEIFITLEKLKVFSRREDFNTQDVDMVLRTYVAK